VSNSIPSDPNGRGNVERPSGRYRYSAGRPLDPSEGYHPELTTDNQPCTSAGVPDSPAALIAMQDKSRNPRPEKPERQPSARVDEVFAYMEKLDTCAADELELARRLVRRLEGLHDEVVEDLRNDADASHSQLISWSIDADRLMRSRMLLESIDLD